MSAVSLLLCVLGLVAALALLRLLTGPLLPDTNPDLAELRAIRARQEGTIP